MSEALELRLLERLAALPGAIVAFSGGVDSAVLLHAAARALTRERVVAVTARSPSLPSHELDEARAFTAGLGVEHRVLDTQELAREGYRRNDPDRCYHCKSELFDVVAREFDDEVRTRGFAVAFGAIVDDLADHRPGARAAKERGVLAPLADAGFDKLAVRDYARRHALAVAEKPSFACLGSRVAYGTPIDAGLLGRLEQGESLLRARGFRQFRLRHHGVIARIEVLPEDLPRLVALRVELEPALRELGWRYVTVDLGGFRSGSMNEVLPR
ncbi:MAG: ATP-dependent sacrificial sulfur transferase LarE [Planctomycetes bacterium]|nr:ATP-dependent sacrificial sulfur transferase LarE [Planctomycetota bacterium]